jgi:hypothetical protein
LQVAQTAPPARVIEQCVVGEAGSGDDICAHCLSPPGSSIDSSVCPIWIREVRGVRFGIGHMPRIDRPVLGWGVGSAQGREARQV